MKNKSFATLGTLALLAAASAFGQQKVQADIPFEFSIQNTNMPAGHYDVTWTRGVLRVHNDTSRGDVTTITSNIGGASGENAEVRLVFNKYGDKYFLAEVWPSSDATYGVGLGKSRTEREIAGVTPQVARIAIPLRTGVAALAALR